MKEEECFVQAKTHGVTQKLCLHNVSDSFVLLGNSRDHRKCCSEIRTRRRDVDGRQIERSNAKVGQSVGSMSSVCLCVIQPLLLPRYKMFAFLNSLFLPVEKSVGGLFFVCVDPWYQIHTLAASWRTCVSQCER